MRCTFPGMEDFWAGVKRAWLGWLIIVFLVVFGGLAMLKGQAPPDSSGGDTVCEIDPATGMERCWDVPD